MYSHNFKQIYEANLLEACLLGAVLSCCFVLSMIKKMGSSSSGNNQFTSPTNQACAACKHQRRKCTPECPLAPFFPPEQSGKFQAAHKIYGVSNILKILNRFHTFEDKKWAVETLCWEAEMRNADPKFGSYGVYIKQEEFLQKMQENFNKELQNKQKEVDFYANLLYSQCGIVVGGGGRSHEEQQGQHFVQSASDYSSAQACQNNHSLYSSEDDASLYPLCSSVAAMVQAQTPPPHSYAPFVQEGSKVDYTCGGADVTVMVPAQNEYMISADTESLMEENSIIQTGKEL